MSETRLFENTATCDAISLASYLKTSWLAVLFKHHFQVHIKLGSYSGIDGSFDTLLNESRKAGGKVKIANRNSNFAVI